MLRNVGEWNIKLLEVIKKKTLFYHVVVLKIYLSISSLVFSSK